MAKFDPFARDPSSCESRAPVVGTLPWPGSVRSAKKFLDLLKGQVSTYWILLDGTLERFQCLAFCQGMVENLGTFGNTIDRK